MLSRPSPPNPPLPIQRPMNIQHECLVLTRNSSLRGSRKCCKNHMDCFFGHCVVRWAQARVSRLGKRPIVLEGRQKRCKQRFGPVVAHGSFRWVSCGRKVSCKGLTAFSICCFFSVFTLEWNSVKFREHLSEILWTFEWHWVKLSNIESNWVNMSSCLLNLIQFHASSFVLTHCFANFHSSLLLLFHCFY